MTGAQTGRAGKRRPLRAYRQLGAARGRWADLDQTIRKLGFDGVARPRIIYGLLVGVGNALQVAVDAPAT